MAAEPGGIASKLGAIYERRYAIEQLIRLIRGRIVRLRWEPASGEGGGADIELEDANGLTEHVQLKRQNRAVADWTPAALDREGVLEAAARVTDSSPKARFAFVSSDPVPHLKDICEQLTRHDGTEAAFVRDRIARPAERRACFDELLGRWKLVVGDAGDEAKAIRRLRAMSFRVLDRGDEGEERLSTLIQACLTGDPAVASALLAAFLEANLSKNVSAQAVLDHLAAKGVLPRDLSRDPSLPTAMLGLRSTFIESLRSRLVAGGWIPRSQVSEIVSKVIANDAPRIILLHGKPGAGKSGVQLGVVEELVSRNVPILPISLSTQPPEGSVLQFGQALGLRATPAAALRAVAGEGRAVLLVDQLDALRLTTAVATATWGTCASMLREAALDPKTVLIVACRTFDLENDANIKRWKEAIEKSVPGGVVAIEIGELNELDLKPVLRGVGVDYGSLPPRLKKLLLHPSALDAWYRLVVRGSTRRDFATQTQLVSALIDTLRAEAVREHGATDGEVFAALSAARAFMETTGRLSAPLSALDAHRNGLNACRGAGLMVRSGAAVSFPHQSYFDHLVAVAALAASGHSPGQIVAWVKQDQSLERRDQLRQLLFVLHDEHPAVAADVCGALLRDGDVRFHLKHLVLGVLREADPISPEDIALVSALGRDSVWREHVIGRVLWRSIPWFDAMFERGVWADLIAGSEGDDKVRWLKTALTVMEHRPAEIDRLLAPLLVAPGGVELLGKALWWDPAEDSPSVAALRDGQIRDGKWAVPDIMLDRVAQRDPVRLVRLVDSTVRGLLRKAAAAVAAGDDGRIEILREGSLDKEVARAVRSEGTASFPVLARLIRLCERLQQRCSRQEADAAGSTRAQTHLKSMVKDLFKSLTRLTAHAIAGVADRNVEELCKVLGAAPTSPGLIRAIASGIALAPDTASDPAIDWLLADPARLELSGGNGDEGRNLSFEVVRQHAPTCSWAALDRLESSLLKLIPSDEKRRYRYLVENYLSQGRWGHNDRGRYRPLFSPIGRAQHLLLGAIPESRRSAMVVERLRVWDGKFGGPAQGPRGDESTAGWVGSPVPADRLGRISDAQWLDIVSRKWTRAWKQVGPDQIAESSPEHFANDLKVAAEKQPRRFIQLFLKFPKDVPVVYLSRLWDALAGDAVDVESCEAAQLQALIARTVTASDDYCLMAACRAVRSHPNAPWESAAWALVSAAASRDNPPAGEYSVQDEVGGKRRPDPESTSLNCVRGSAAAAMAALAWNNSDRCKVVITRAAPLLTDPHPAVRLAAAHIAYGVYTVDRDAGIDMLMTIAAAGDDRVLGGRWFNRLVGRGRWSHPGALRELIERMAESSEPSIAKQGARWVTAERFQLDACKDAYSRCRQGSDEQRAGVAETLGHLVLDDHASHDAIETELITLFDDPSASVQAVAANVFRLESVLESDAGPRLADAFVRSKAFSANSEDLIWPVSHQAVDLVKYKTTVFVAGDRFATELAEQTRSMQNRLGMAGRELSALLLRLYDAATKLGDPDLAKQCLDRWDALLESRVGDSDAHLDALL